MEETGMQLGKEVNEGTSNTVKERSISPLDLGMSHYQKINSYICIYIIYKYSPRTYICKYSLSVVVSKSFMIVET